MQMLFSNSDVDDLREALIATGPDQKTAIEIIKVFFGTNGYAAFSENVEALTELKLIRDRTTFKKTLEQAARAN